MPNGIWQSRLVSDYVFLSLLPPSRKPFTELCSLKSGTLAAHVSIEEFYLQINTYIIMTMIASSVTKFPQTKLKKFTAIPVQIYIFIGS